MEYTSTADPWHGGADRSPARWEHALVDEFGAESDADRVIHSQDVDGHSPDCGPADDPWAVPDEVVGQTVPAGVEQVNES